MEVFPAQEGQQRFVVLRDPCDPEVDPIALGNGAAEILALMDGQRSVAAIHAALQMRGVSMSLAEVTEFMQRLDAAGYLEGPRARRRLEQRQASFRTHPVRVAVHAGGGYPDGMAELPQFLAAGYLHEDGPGALPSRGDAPRGTPAGLMAPHIDLHRGAPTYSWGYRALVEAQPADLYVVLGTCHNGVQGAFAGTRKPYDTPLGAIPSDGAFLNRVGALWGRDLYEGEFAHATEHSIEFQAVYLRSMGLAGDGAATMAPILCDSLHSLVPEPASPRDLALVADFVSALRQAIVDDGRRITVIAAVDLAHVGPRFGDRWLADAENMQRVRRQDLEMLSLVAHGDAEGYYHQVMRDHDARRICGFTPTYLLTELMGGSGNRRGALQRYTQWTAADRSSGVTFASMLFA